MALSHEDISFYLELLHRSVNPNTPPIYNISVDNYHIILNTQNNQRISIASLYLADIHTILRMHHGSQPYNIILPHIYDDIGLHIDLYSYHDRPTHLTLNHRIKKSQQYSPMLCTKSIPDVDCHDTPITTAIEQMRIHIHAHFTFMAEDPYMHYYMNQQFVGIKCINEPIPGHPTIRYDYKIEYKHPSHDVYITIYLREKRDVMYSIIFHIAYKHIDQLTALYSARITYLVDRVLDEPDPYLDGQSQHARINFMRAIHAHIADPEHPMQQRLTRAIEHMHQHYRYIDPSILPST